MNDSPFETVLRGKTPYFSQKFDFEDHGILPLSLVKCKTGKIEITAHPAIVPETVDPTDQHKNSALGKRALAA